MAKPTSILWDHVNTLLMNYLSANDLSKWIAPLQPYLHGQTLVLYAPNDIVRDHVEKNFSSYFDIIIPKFEEFNEVRIAIGSTQDIAETADDHFSTNDKSNNDFAPNLNIKYQFDNFVEGRSNMFARAQGIQVANRPGIAANPLFIYGGVGLGKTHLLHAIGNKIIANNGNAKVLYTHSDRFVDEMVMAIRLGKMDEFKTKYRNLNALLIDDVQFFAGKEKSQEVFFHTFNALFESQQQIVLTSDRFPKQISELEDRLKSRFGWGLTVEVEPPDLETRVAITLSKSTEMGYMLPNDVAFIICKNVSSNIRELEGALRRVLASADFSGKPITPEFAKNVLRDQFAAQAKQVSIDNIQKVVSQHFNIKISQLLSSNRSRSIARPRQIAMALSRELTNTSLPEIGRAFGGKDHATVIHASKRIVELMASDQKLEDDYRIIKRKLMS